VADAAETMAEAGVALVTHGAGGLTMPPIEMLRAAQILVIQDNTPQPKFFGTGTVTKISGDASFLAAFGPVGSSHSFDWTEMPLSCTVAANCTTLDQLATTTASVQYRAARIFRTASLSPLRCFWGAPSSGSVCLAGGGERPHNLTTTLGGGGGLRGRRFFRDDWRRTSRRTRMS
jgi:hypothetical protein